MTVDAKGNPMVGLNNGQVAMFDAKAEMFVQIPGTNNNHRGVAVAPDGMVYASNAGGNNGCGLNQIDSNTMTAVQFTFPHAALRSAQPASDVAGFVWMVDHSGWPTASTPTPTKRSRSSSPATTTPTPI